MAAQRMCRVVHTPLGQQRLELDPQRFDKPGWEGRHGRSSFSITGCRQLRDLEAPCLRYFTPGPTTYLRGL